MTRQQRVEAVAKVVFRHRNPTVALRHPDDFTDEDLWEAERFVDMLDAQFASGSQ